MSAGVALNFEFYSPDSYFARATSPNQIKIENTCCIVGRPLDRRPGCPVRVICGHGGRTSECPLYPRKRTSSANPKWVKTGKARVEHLTCAAGRQARRVVLSDNRRRHHGRATVAVVLLPGLRSVWLDRPAHARPASRRVDFESHPVSVVTPVFTECAVCAVGTAHGRALGNFNVQACETQSLSSILDPSPRASAKPRSCSL